MNDGSPEGVSKECIDIIKGDAKTKELEDAIKVGSILRVGKNGYDWRSLTKYNWRREADRLTAAGIRVRCFICNKKTAKMFNPPYAGHSIVTINNSIPDYIIYINRIG